MLNLIEKKIFFLETQNGDFQGHKLILDAVNSFAPLLKHECFEHVI